MSVVSVEPDRTATGIDTTVPHSARIWNYWLGGKDNYAVDRAAGEAWLKVDPNITVMARATRAFLRRSVEYLARDVGIRQFLDIGTGLPTADNTHEVAQRVAPDARVVYVDNDPLVLAHARALLTGTPEGSTRYLHADMRDAAVLAEGAAEILDLSQPVAVFFMGVLGHVADTAEARGIVQAVMARVSSGSHLTVCDGTPVDAPTTAGGPGDGPSGRPAGEPADDDLMGKAQEDYADSGAVPYWNRPHEEIRSFFDGLDFVEPGFVSIPQWRPDDPDTPPTPLAGYGGVARKP